MNVLVTCGPSFEPIDEVRRLTNFSSGELGARLSQSLASAGHRVTCFRGSGSTYPAPESGSDLRFESFDTNDDLFGLLQRASLARPQADAIFHVAALCDYRIARVQDETGRDCRAAKIASRSGRIQLLLEPATKLIGRLRPMFPKARLVGWKYELNGTRADALRKAWDQIAENRTDACVLNGQAFGPGFAFCQPPQTVHECAGKSQLIEFLVSWLEEPFETRLTRD